MTPELKPCPFCGGKATFDHDDAAWEWITCLECGIETSARVSLMEDCKPLLAEQWNKRAEIKPTYDMLAAGIYAREYMLGDRLPDGEGFDDATTD